MIWFGLSWSEMKRELRDETMSPAGHALALGVSVYNLFRVHAHFRVLNDMLIAVGAHRRMRPGWVVFIYGVALSSVWLAPLARLPTLGLLTILIYYVAYIGMIAYGQAGLNAYWQALPGRTVPVRVTRGEWVALVAALPTWVFLTMVLPGSSDFLPVLPAWSSVFISFAGAGAVLAGVLLLLLHYLKAPVSSRRAVVCFGAGVVFLGWGAFAIIEPLKDGRGQVVGVVNQIEQKPSVESQLSYNRLTLGLQPQIDEFVIPALGTRGESRLRVPRGRASMTLELHPSEPDELDLEALQAGKAVRATYRNNDFVVETLELIDEGRSRPVYRAGPPVPEIALGVVCLAIGATVCVLGISMLRSREPLLPL